MSVNFLKRVSLDIADRSARQLLRTLDTRGTVHGAKTTIDGRDVVNFCSNDYLGLASHERVIQRVANEVKRYGLGSGSASLLSGRSSLHAELETKLARLVGAESSLIFSSGYLANIGTIPALVGKADFIFHDRLNHASLIDGVLASNALHKRYPHSQVPEIPTPSEQSGGVKMLVTESVFSMDGDLVDLKRLALVARESDSVLYVDDAHGFGVIGNGKGAAGVIKYNSERSPTTIAMVTFGKALGSMGAAVVAPAEVVQMLVQKSRTYIYDTALPPICVAGALEALDLLENIPAIRQALFSNIKLFREEASKAQIPVLDSASPIQPIILGKETTAINVANHLLKQGFYVRPIRPPTVPRGTSRIRLTITASHTNEEIIRLVGALKEVIPSIL